MTVQDTSLAAFLELIESGVRHTLQTEVYRAICEIGPVHNLRLLEYLRQKEVVDKKKGDRIVWTRSNCWPRVTDLVDLGAVHDAGRHRLDWQGRNKSLHVWYVASASAEIPKQWTKITPKLKPPPKPKLPAVQQISSASQAGRILAMQRHKKPKSKSAQGTLFPVG